MAPAQTRPRGENTVAAPSLQILAFQDGRPVFPDPLLRRFPAGTPEQAKIDAEFDKFKAKFPQQARPSPQSQAVPARSGGLCDFSLDEGKMPVDPHRPVDLPAVKDADFQVRRTSVRRRKLIEL